MTYTISTILPAGETHEMYGTKYVVKFAEDAQTYELWFKKQPDVGSTLEGTIEGGKFKKEKKAWDGGAKQPYKKPFGAVQADKNDGQRQGMCINNAAQFVLAKSEKTLTPSEWADAVFKYATALYSKGDMKATTTTQGASTESQNEPDSSETTKQDVLDIFGA
jgi:hypothetical protein